jgi:hypothetical protein
VTAERDELRRLVEDLPDERVPAALDELRRQARPRAAGHWPPAWFASSTAARTDTAARADELLAEGFGRPA